MLVFLTLFYFNFKLKISLLNKVFKQGIDSLNNHVLKIIKWCTLGYNLRGWNYPYVSSFWKNFMAFAPASLVCVFDSPSWSTGTPTPSILSSLIPLVNFKALPWRPVVLHVCPMDLQQHLRTGQKCISLGPIPDLLN